MTPLTKAVFRRSQIPFRGRRLVASLEPGDLIGVREERTRKTYYIPITAVYSMAVKMSLLADRRQKIADREAKKAARLR